jgi:undecaprenyl-diphosphatase
VNSPLGILDAIVLGLVEGITEALPVSSTGHLVVTASLLGLDSPEQVRGAMDTLLIVIQGGAILAVLWLFRHSIGRMLRGLAGQDRGGLLLTRNVLIAFLPVAVLGPLLDDWIESRLMQTGPVLLALGVGGVVMIMSDRRLRRRANMELEGDQLSAVAAFQIGLLQCLAMWPGTSRLMVTLLGGMLVGMRPAAAARFSFLLAVPTIGGATVWKLLKAGMSDRPDMFTVLGWTPILIGLGVAAVATLFTIRWLMSYLTRHGLAAFGWYRVALTAALVVLVLGGIVSIGPPSDQSAADTASVEPDVSITPSRPIANTLGWSPGPRTDTWNSTPGCSPALPATSGMTAGKGPPPVTGSQRPSRRCVSS